MNSIIIEISKYIFIILMFFYVSVSFCRAAAKKDTVRNMTDMIQNVIMILFHFLGYFVLYIGNEKIEFLILYAAQLVFFVVFKTAFSLIYKNSSRSLVNNMCMLMAVGFVMLARLSFYRCVRQTVFAAAAGILSLAVPWLVRKVKSLRDIPFLYFVSGIALLLAVLISDEVFGAKLSITVGNISIQPTELVKIIYVMFIAAMFNASLSFKRVLATTFMAALHVVILVLSKDLGAALIFFVVYVFMLYYATRKWYYILAGMCAGAAASIAAYRIFAHIRVRVLVWLDPWVDIDDKGYQITQSLFSIGTGSWTGTGLGQGSPNMIPIPEKDFIFSAIAEEFGIFFCIGLLILMFINLVLIMKTAAMCRTVFYRLTAAGIGITYAFQVFLTVGGGIKLIPLTGVTLPFVSYGGSSLVSSMIMFAVINGIFIMREQGYGQSGKTASGRSAKNKRDCKKLKKADRSANNKKKQGSGSSGNKKKPADVLADAVKDRETSVIICVFAVLFALLIGYMSYFNAAEAPKILNNPYNKRISAQADKVIRGSIMADNGAVLAYTKVSGDGSEGRVYPYGSVFSHVVGMSQRGRSGLEGMCNSYLMRPKNSIIDKAYSEITGKKQTGSSVVTTLDVQLQRAAYDALGDNKGAIVVMEPSTGKILAMVSKPDFDPNDALEQWETWLSYEKSDSVLLNRAAQGLYPPGSTFKTLTALEYIRENKDHGEYGFDCSGSIDVMGSLIHCNNSTAHGHETLASAYADSCNSAFSDIGLSIDGNRLNQLCRDFLFNRDLPVSIDHSRSSFTMTDSSSVGEKMQTAIGQGKTQITPLHNAIITSAVANDGILMRPYLVEKILYPDNKVLQSYKPEEFSRPVTKEEARVIKDYMRGVCTGGTGRSFRNTPYDVSGKTGTAQFDDTSDMSHSWFTGFAPSDSPQIVISVVLEGGYTGYDSAQQAAKKVFDAFFEKS